MNEVNNVYRSFLIKSQAEEGGKLEFQLVHEITVTKQNDEKQVEIDGKGKAIGREITKSQHHQ